MWPAALDGNDLYDFKGFRDANGTNGSVQAEFSGTF
jgi:hypothetical protein